ncbi:DUF4345 domain-containing protein [Pleomorphovibrio marinus]|uniref:DUF4345 domain-containing protein n=1 Tax=Pleomorphovibrio marinus TaxID=2164132 RepID=UPI001E344EBC|nr:DUF4345 domain-containing protein [Pleomorphovibrio marinus]
MNTTKILDKAAKGYTMLSLLSLLYVSLLAMIAPQKIMDMVHINLGNTDAISSIRGVYGGVGLSICFSLVYLLFQKPNWALGFLVVFWGCYAISRVMTILMEGLLGNFGSQWLLIEAILFLLGAGLLTSIGLQKKQAILSGS